MACRVVTHGGTVRKHIKGSGTGDGRDRRTHLLCVVELVRRLELKGCQAPEMRRKCVPPKFWWQTYAGSAPRTCFASWSACAGDAAGTRAP